VNVSATVYDPYPLAPGLVKPLFQLGFGGEPVINKSAKSVSDNPSLWCSAMSLPKIQ
jgi:hypothetical protein